MKINNEQLRALQESEARRPGAKKLSEGFDELFSRQLDQSQPAGVTRVDGPPLAGVFAAPVADVAREEPAESFTRAAAQLEGMFSTFESYAGQLALDDKADLRQAFNLLERMSGQISEFRSNFPDVKAEQPQLSAMLDELDALAVTETFKFNRGDYF